MRRALFAVIGLFTAPLAAQDPAAVIDRGLLPMVRIAGRDERVALAARMRSLDVPAVSIAIIDNGRIVFARAYGFKDVANEVPADTATLFQAASISKPVAALGMLRLVAAGKVTLDGDVNRWLRSWHLPDTSAAGAKPVTLRAIASHTAGTTVHGFEGYNPDSTLPTLPQILDGKPPANSDPVRVVRVPGTEMVYSGGGTTIEQLVMQDVTGRPFAAYMHNEVLAPLGMKRSTYAQPLPRERWSDAAIGYRHGGVLVDGRWHAYPEQAAAGLWTTPADLARMLIGVRDLVTRGGRYLPDSLTRQILIPQAGGPVGIGFFVAGAGDSLRFGHGGANEGYRAQVWMYTKSGDGAVVMTNSDGGQALANEILNTIADAYGWPGYLSPPITPVVLSEEMARSFTGEFQAAGIPPVNIIRDGEDLIFTLLGDRPMQMIPTSDSTFVLPQANATIRFPGAPTRTDSMLVTLGARVMRFGRK